MTDKLAKAIGDEISDLVRIGDGIAALAGRASDHLNPGQITETSAWVSRIGEIIRKLYGTTSQHLKHYADLRATENFYLIHAHYSSHISAMNGIIKAIEHEFNTGLYKEFKEIVQADIFADFLEMSEYLLDNKYKDASAVIVGSVLENNLRKLALNNSINVTNSDGKPLNMEVLNVECAKAFVYDKLIQKQITSWGDLRNNAAHGNYQKYDIDQVRMMLLFVQKFVSDYRGT